MSSHRFYYTLKPYLPWRVRMALRRISARRKRAASTQVWPIDERAARTPPGWTGWPDGRKFACVLTHDVEGPVGLAKCRRLAELEMKLGFRSGFNFIPEGSYEVTDELRAWLVENGFEVGVHDLHHDGRLYRSKRAFEEKAARINRYLQKWRAAGFRSGFMLRNLDWLHALGIGYDSSTFDTDPFEPQSDGAGTIFPYWIPAPRHSKPGQAGPRPATQPNAVEPPAGQSGTPFAGYVELPYTLPQDSTLFLVLQEQTPEIWLRKLDWIAAHGGMALINVHPDYLQFEDEPPSPRTYPVAHYIRFLEAVRDRHAGAYWSALPSQVAGFVNQLKFKPVLRQPLRVGMITHSFYETDNRVSRYAEALVARGDEVDVVALRRSPALPCEETIEGVRVHRLQDRFGKTERSMWSYLWPSLRFFMSSAWWTTRRHARHRFDVLHVHNIPDFLVFAAWYPKLRGTRLILDIHDIVPEFFGSKFGGEKPAAMWLLKWIERRSARFASHVIISNHLWFEKYVARTGMDGRCSVFINNVNTRVFAPRERTRRDDRQIILFPGGLQWHQGLDIALRAFVRVNRECPRTEFHIYGDGNVKPQLVALAAELGFNGQVKFFEPVRITEIAQVMANADLGVVPKRADSFGNEAYSTKIMEFMALGVPVVASRTKIDQFYFDDSVVRFFESGNPDALADAMLDVLRDSELRSKLVTNASAYSERNSWKTRQADYLQLVDSLAARPDAK